MTSPVKTHGKMGSLQGILSIKEIEIENKTVFMRLDLNVPLKNGIIQDETRIREALPSIQYALNHQAQLIIASHLGRPRIPEDLQHLSLEPIAKRLSEILNVEVILVENPESETIQFLLQTWKSRQVILLENLRFDPRETKNDNEWARTLCRHVDIYINDAFGASHRAHSSVVGIPAEVETSGIGFLIEKEIQALDHLLYESEPPFAAILGGSKVSDKVSIIDHLIDKVDVFLIGGAMAYTFLKAQGVSVGDSKVETKKIYFVNQFFERLHSRHKKCVLPIDHVVTPAPKDGKAKDGETLKENERLEAKNARQSANTTSQKNYKVGVKEIERGWMGVDIGPQTIQLFHRELTSMKTIFWNGPMGIFEEPEFSSGTFAVAKALRDHKGAFCVVGGGDSAAAVKASGDTRGIDHISTGGGASLEYLQGVALPGLEALRKKKPESKSGGSA